MKWTRTIRNLGLGLLLIAGVAVAVVLGLTIERTTRGQDRALAQELVIHHFERSSWLALNAGKYEAIDPDLAHRFRESAAWHAKRAREFQRMNPGDVVRESERDLEHDRSEAQLLERSLRIDSLMTAKGQAAEGPERDEGRARAAPP